jgi:hypothetical protein
MRRLACVLVVLASCSPFHRALRMQVTDEVGFEPCKSMTWLGDLAHVELDVDAARVAFPGHFGEIMRAHVGSSSLPVTSENQFAIHAELDGPARDEAGCHFAPRAELSLLRPPSQPIWEGTLTLQKEEPDPEVGCSLCEVAIILRAPR